MKLLVKSIRPAAHHDPSNMINWLLGSASPDFQVDASPHQSRLWVDSAFTTNFVKHRLSHCTVEPLILCVYDLDLVFDLWLCCLLPLPDSCLWLLELWFCASFNELKPHPASPDSNVKNIIILQSVPRDRGHVCETVTKSSKPKICYLSDPSTNLQV